MGRRHALAAIVVLLCVAAGAIWYYGLRGDPGSGAAVPDRQQEQVKLRFTYWGSPEERNSIENAMAKFMDAYPWITVEPIQIPNADYNTRLKAMIASNEGPDIGYMTPDLGEQLAEQNKFRNLLEFLHTDSELKKADFLDYIWYMSAPEYAWGISSAGESYGLFYRRDLLEQAGIAAPPVKAEDAWDWETFVDAAKTLTIDQNGRNAHHKRFDKERIVQYGVMFETWAEPLNTFIFSNNGDWVSPDGKKFVLNRPEAADAIQRVADLMNVHHVAPSPFDTKSMPATSVALLSGQAAMIIDGQWNNLDLGRAKVDYDIGVLPKLERSITVVLSGATVIFNSTRHPEEAWMLFKWLSDPDKALELYADGLWMPILKRWYTQPELVSRWVDANPYAHPPGFKQAMMEQMITNGVRGVGYYLKDQSDIYPVVTEGLYPVWLGEKSAAEALDEIHAQLLPLFQSN